MKNKHVLAASLLASLMTLAGASLAAQPGTPMDNRQVQGGPPSSMPGAMGGQMPGMMGGSMADQMPGMMMGGRQGMGGMMAGCPMMGGMTGVLTPQQQMQMHAEMMQAMGQIMEKYAGEAGKKPN